MPTIFLKPESVNTKTKAPARHPDAMASIGERHGKEKICAAIFSAKRNSSAVSGAAQHRNPTEAA
jgi:hypothetical protein